jgi:glutamine synthetase
LFRICPRFEQALLSIALLKNDALESLESDHAFLLKGDVFNKDFIEAYSALKWEEVYALEHTPHPIEYQMYYSG